jgi:DNA-binding PadR family transcriptional regulator
LERELLLLGLLREHGMHGYQLLEFIDTQMSSCVDLKKPTAYFLLDKMAAAGWIAHEAGQEGNRPPRRVYRITPEGEKEFQRLLRENLAAYPPVHFVSDVGIAFVDQLPPAEALALLKQRRAVLAGQLAAVQAAPEHPGGAQLLIEHQAHHLTSELAWLDAVISRLAKLAKPAKKREASGVKRQVSNVKGVRPIS